MQHVNRQLSELAEKSIEGILTTQEVRELENLCSSKENLRFYTDYLALHAHLRLSRGQSSPATLPVLEIDPVLGVEAVLDINSGNQPLG